MSTGEPSRSRSQPDGVKFGAKDQSSNVNTPKKPAEMNHLSFLRSRLRIHHTLMRNLLSEFYATAVLRFIGTGVMAQFVLSRGTFNAPIQVNLGWGFAIALSVYLGWKTSGGHVNPAVTAVLFIVGKITLLHSVLYCIAQTAGAAFGSAISQLVYLEALNDFDGGVRSIDGPNGTGIIFASFPAPYLSNTGAFIDQIAGTGFLGLFVAFFCEPRNEIPLYLQPMLFGAVATAIGICYGMNMGSPVNPASDFGSRITASLSGYGLRMFTYHNYFFIVPLIAPIFGAAIGAYSYLMCIGFHIPDAQPKVNRNGTDALKDEEKMPLKFVFVA